MLKSMTGFGAVTFENDTVSVTVEVRSINSKSQDFSFRLPRIFQEKETEVKNLLGQTLERGKVSLSIDFSRKGAIKPKLTINPVLFRAYYDDLYKNAASLNIPLNGILRIVTQMPEVYDADKSAEDAEQDWELVYKCIKEAVQRCEEFRKAEGKVLENQLSGSITMIGDRLQKITDQDPQRIAKTRERLHAKVEEFVAAGKIDPVRFEQELIYYIEKLDITEEKVRLKAHLDYFIETVNQADANGKKLGFISQEIGREINTIGSKANDAVIQKWVVEMKEELEKIKEQSLNVL